MIRRYCWWFRNPAPVDSFTLLFTRGFIHPRWLLGISELLTVWTHGNFTTWIPQQITPCSKPQIHVPFSIIFWYQQYFLVESTLFYSGCCKPPPPCCNLVTLAGKMIIPKAHLSSSRTAPAQLCSNVSYKTVIWAMRKPWWFSFFFQGWNPTQLCRGFFIKQHFKDPNSTNSISMESNHVESTITLPKTNIATEKIHKSMVGRPFLFTERKAIFLLAMLFFFWPHDIKSY